MMPPRNFPHPLACSQQQRTSYAFLVATLFTVPLLLLLAGDVATNPGPRKPKYPCGECNHAVKWSDKGVACDDCETWFHARCVHMCDEVYDVIGNYTWVCHNCGLPKFSSSIFTSIPADSLTVSTLPPGSDPQHIPKHTLPQTSPTQNGNFLRHPELSQDIQNLSKSCPSSLIDLTHETNSQLDPSVPSSPSITKTLGPPKFTSSPVGEAPPQHHRPPKTAPETFSTISAASDQFTDIPSPVKPKASLRVLVINFRSIRPKRFELWNLIDSTKPDIILGSETWLRADILDTEILPSNFDVFRKDRSDAHGGVLIATSKTLIANEVTTESKAEGVLISIKTASKTANLVVGSLYRAPDATNPTDTSEMLKIMDTACKKDKQDIVWLGGDFNLPDIDWVNGCTNSYQYPKSMNDNYLDKINELGLTQINRDPTREDSILDIFLTNRPSLVTRCCTIPGLSDHDILLVDSNIMPAKRQATPRTVHIWKKADLVEIIDDIKSFTADLIQTTTDDTTVEDIWQKIKTALLNALNKHVPTKKLSAKFHQPWVNTTIKRLSRRKNRAWRKAKKTLAKKDWDRFKSLQKQTRRACREAYFSYVSELVGDEGDSKKMWRFIKSRKCDSSGVSPLKKGGLVYSDAKEKADILNEQFSSVFTEEDLSSLPDIGKSEHPPMPDIEVSEAGVCKLLLKLNPRKATGPDLIPCRLLQAVAKELAPALTFLFRKSLLTSKIPADWRHAYVNPIHKKSSRSIPGNYRPISLTSVCGKLLEHIVRASITTHFDTHGIIVDSQHGFRKKRSCTTQLILTIDDLARGLKEKQQTDTILLDFEKAFDKVPHRRLLLKLDYYGVRGQTLQWIEAFLSNRTQQVVVDGQFSSPSKVTSGVPQGSVLGPTLFLAYINDLPQHVRSKVKLFADDTLLYRGIRTVDDTKILQEDLCRLEVWEKKWQMSFNANKCHLLSVTKKTKPVLSSYKLHNQDLEQVESAKYLGVEISRDIGWKRHIQSATSKAQKISAFITRNLRGLPIKAQTNCYKGMVRPIVEYASPVWDPHDQSRIDEIEMVQRKSARRIFQDFGRTTSATNLVNRLGLDTLQLRRTIFKAQMMYKIINGLVDVTPAEGTLRKKGRTTRGNPAKFHTPDMEIDAYKHSFFPSAISLWNSLPATVTEAGSYQAFGTAVGAWLRGQL